MFYPEKQCLDSGKMDYQPPDFKDSILAKTIFITNVNIRLNIQAASKQ